MDKLIIRFSVFVLSFVVMQSCFGDILVIKPLSAPDDLELQALCRFDSKLTQKDLKKILESSEIPGISECHIGALKILAAECRSKADTNFIVCVDELALYLEPPLLMSDKFIFIVGDLFIKKSRLYERDGKFIESANALEVILTLGPSEALAESLVDEISRLYLLSDDSSKVKDILLHWVDYLDRQDSNLSSVRLGYIKAYLRLAELTIVAEDYLDAAKFLEKTHLYLLGGKDCWVYGWRELIYYQAEIAKQWGEDSSSYVYYSGLVKSYDEISELVEKEPLEQVSSAHNESIIKISYLCPWVLQIEGGRLH
ncbi:hypothetical protein [Teredinibacter haidensis]|uniref:hypothetical protein n=1 Tax=Teredinibacter haidensis TaxID=2731755 RepID=UPI000948D878|nr:hypothetical protein [Teredinibacter haidensis]